MGKEKKEKVEKKVRRKRKGVFRAVVGVSLALTMLAGVGVCNAALSGTKVFSTVSTGSVLDRFVPAKAEQSKEETQSFFQQAADGFLESSDTEYTSYTLQYSANLEKSKDGLAYHNTWKDVVAQVDKDYTAVTIVNRETEGTIYRRTVREYVVCKTGENAGKTWGRFLEDDQAVGDFDLLDKEEWTPINGTIANEMRSALALLLGAQYGDYDVVQGQFNYSVERKGTIGYGTLKPGKTPTLTFSYFRDDEGDETGHHEWKCSYLNATKVFIPNSLSKVMGGAA